MAVAYIRYKIGIIVTWEEFCLNSLETILESLMGHLLLLIIEYCTDRTYTRNQSGPALPLYQTNT